MSLQADTSDGQCVSVVPQGLGQDAEFVPVTDWIWGGCWIAGRPRPRGLSEPPVVTV